MRLRTDSSVYEVKPGARDGRKRLLHCILLLPCNFQPKTDQKKGKNACMNTQRTEQSESDSDEVLFYVKSDPRKPEDKPEDNHLQLISLGKQNIQRCNTQILTLTPNTRKPTRTFSYQPNLKQNPHRGEVHAYDLPQTHSPIPT